MKIIDTHCHYNLSPLLDQWSDHWQRAQQAGVISSIVVGANWESSQQAVQIAQTESKLWAAVGVHPDEFSLLDSNLANNLDNIYQQLSTLINQKVIAIGEIGLDYFHLASEPSDKAISINQQQQAFKKQLALATTQALPVIIHVRDKTVPEYPTPGNAYWDTLSILKPYLSSLPGFVLHCVSGPLQYIKVALDLGAYIGVAANVTYKNAQQIREIVNLVPSNRILLETDAPFLPPQSFRGQTCEPWMITETATFFKDQFQIDLDQVTNNSYQLFPKLKT